MTESTIHSLVIAHASLGGLALFSGLIALITKKGSKPHRMGGKVFFWSLLFSGCLALLVASLPGHESPFLFAIGIFSIYLILTGYLALRYKNPETNLLLDKIISAVMIVTGIFMIIVPVLQSGQINIVLTVFGSIGISLAIQDLKLFRNKEKLQKGWLISHLGKMIGGYIAATTAFIVVNQFFPPLIGWIGPTVVGTIFIIYWSRKVSR
ncbi:MAG: DUF2306 domain-containing protein [Crocinitomicaceae bacterium]|nr:DUF2306 domain-containing protein [Crocinitomicaceae bacterium]